MSLFPGHAFAAYDPNFVISDPQMTDRNAMSEAQIQDFLVSKGSFLANFTVPASRTVTYYIDNTRTLTTYENTIIGPYGSSTEVDVQGWKASRVIWQVCQWYGVSPQAALVIIEKESNFILGRTSGRSDGSIAVPGANSYATYAWIMGYAYTEDTTNPAKNVCGTATAGANPGKSCAGFAAQLDNGIWAVANWMNLANAQSAGNDYSCPAGWGGSYRTNYATRLCDGEWIAPRSGATAALYRYTPHTGLTGGYSGNRAFYLIYDNWFTPYNYEFVSAINPPNTMNANTQASVQVVLRNTGTATWRSDAVDPVTPFRLAVNFGASDFYDSTSWIEPSRIRMTTDTVEPNGLGTFTFRIKSFSKPGYRIMRFVPVEENVTALRDISMQFGVTVTAPYEYDFVSAINPPATMASGTEASVQIVLRNTGTEVWNSDSLDQSTPFRLAVVQGNNSFYDSSTWIELTRIKMTTDSVPNGELATFNFKMKAQGNSGYQTIKFIPVKENIFALRDAGMQFGTNVSVTYSYQFVSAINPMATIASGVAQNVQIVLRNTGSAVWKSDAIDWSSPFRLAVVFGNNDFYDVATWVEPTRIKMTTESVANGELATFNFNMKPINNPGYRIMRFLPVEENVAALRDIGMQFGTIITP